LSVSEPQRLALHAAARRALGDEEGDTLMALSPPANTDIATRQDLELTAAELRAHTWKVVVGTGVVLYLAIVGTAFAGVGLLMSILDLT
jgi:hypothetical protein